MFYPFTANSARKETANAKNDRENEEAILLQAYLSIAHVFIHRAARSGYNKTSVYCPYSIRHEFCQALTEAGFIVSAHPMANQFLVSWEENQLLPFYLDVLRLSIELTNRFQYDILIVQNERR